jgi:hypothetical protein
MQLSKLHSASQSERPREFRVHEKPATNAYFFSCLERCFPDGTLPQLQSSALMQQPVSLQ